MTLKVGEDQTKRIYQFDSPALVGPTRVFTAARAGLTQHAPELPGLGLKTSSLWLEVGVLVWPSRTPSAFLVWTPGSGEESGKVLKRP